MNRFYYEQDGDGPKGSRSNAYYVVDSYADPLSDQCRTDITNDGSKSGYAMEKEARALAAQWNANPPWPVWDTIAAKRDGYRDPSKKTENNSAT